MLLKQIAQKTAQRTVGARSNLMGITSSLFSTMEGVTNVDKQGMKEIIDKYEKGGSGYVVMDVREKSEVAASGKLSPNTYTLPLSIMGQALQMDDAGFEKTCGFAKPKPDDTLVFSCMAGSRSVRACGIASAAGYPKIVNYTGGARDWFS